MALFLVNILKDARHSFFYKEKIMSKADKAVALFLEGFSCSQAILVTYGVDLGIKRETALRISDSFGGGMGRMGKTCGAVTGAVMVIGLKHGRVYPEDQSAKDRTVAIVQQFVKRFEAIHHCHTCKDLLGCSINTKEKTAKAAETGVFDRVCPTAVRTAAELLEEMIDSSE